MSAPSPCVNLCVIEPASGLCEGCGRSMAEIGRWPTLSEAERRRITRQLGRRLKALRRSLAEEPRPL
ncbi:DUF1289 domain-containing protein [Alsobacter soli]|uniref:DUF1289 domain-containing protein n=1 Tax=Alsobacter soli TaxID=2109933 RepID=A0A2T1HVS7_9HYPH|nr:DUF1289 domain-containing protein [Alsobacter soli]PSC05766.1 DUF1289 domain-containing protein [Alsobacter soli]